METSHVLEDEYCSAFNLTCRHCNTAVTYHEATKLKPPKPGNKLFENGGRILIRRVLGQYCNNQCEFVDKMKVCPIRWQQANHIDLEAATRKMEKNMKFKNVPEKKPKPTTTKIPMPPLPKSRGQSTLKF